MKIFIIQILFIVYAISLVASDSQRLVWPLAPDEARIEYVASITESKELGIERGFFTKVFEFVFGEKDMKLSSPFGIHADTSRIYVTDIYLKTLNIYDKKENETITIKGSGKEHFLYPIDVVADSSGNVFVSDSVRAKVYVFKKNGDFKYAISSKHFKRPVGIAVSSDDKKLYIVDTLSDQIHVTTLKGKYINSIGKRGTGYGEFNKPTFLDVGKDGNIYISDSMNHRVQILDKNGNYVNSFGRLGQNIGEFANPRGISLDSDENVYISDTIFNSVQIFNKNGEVLMKFGSYGMDRGEFAMVEDISITADNIIYVSDVSNKCFKIFKRLDSDKKKEFKMRYTILFAIVVLLLLNTQVSALVENTKHNLSASNETPGVVVKSMIEIEECVFCHIPHSTRPQGKPLWNRKMPDSEYQMYNSDYLKRMGYETPTNLGTLKNQPGTLSRQCLSCHDGTIAIGAVHKLRQSFMNSNTIAMNTANPAGTMPAGSTNFGSDLRNSHPVGIKYISTPPIMQTPFGVGTPTMELVDIANMPVDSKIRFFEYGGAKYVECSSCHDPHVENGKFLSHGTAASTLADDIVGTCTTCHAKTNWAGSVHQLNAAQYVDTDNAVESRYGTKEVGSLGCANCHMPHNAEGTPYLNRKVQAQTCYQGAASSTTNANCHGLNGAKDVETIVGRTYGHPVNESITDQKHTNLDVLYGYGLDGLEMTDATNIGGVSWESNQHVVCMDCHNPHQAKKNTHVTDGTWYGDPGVDGTDNNDISPVLNGVTGIDMSAIVGEGWPAAWTQPKDFITLQAATKEYQICLKCHSYWGVGTTLTGVTNYTNRQMNTTLTDVAWEMNINNRSGHPVIIPQSQRAPSVTDLYKALDSSQLTTPWDANPGGNTMYCSDCHGAETEVAGNYAADVKGPHGSALKYMLKGASKYWPTKPDGTTLYDTNDIPATGGVVADLFCTNCHNVSVPHKSWVTRMINQNVNCVGCHVAIPHGSPVSRLLGYTSFPAPYDYNNNSLEMAGYRKHALTATNVDNMYSATCASGGMGCHDTTPAGGVTYEADPYP